MREAAVGVLVIVGLSVTESREESTAPRLGHTGGRRRDRSSVKSGLF